MIDSNFHIENTKQTFSLPAKKWHELEHHLNKVRDLINENAEVFDNTKLEPGKALPALKYGQSVFVKKPKK